MRILFSLVLLTAMIFAACGSGDDTSDSSSPDGEPTISESQAEYLLTLASQQAADEALLGPDDFGPGWSENSGEDASEEEVPDEFDQQLEECSGLGEDDEFPGLLAEAESVEYLGPLEQEAETDASVFGSDDEAQAALDLFAQVLVDCRQDFIDLARDAAETAAAEDGLSLDDLGFDVTFDEQTSFELGDASRVFRMLISIAIADVEVTVDFISVRQGRVTGTFTYSAMPNDSERLQLARTFSDKLYRADLTLGGSPE